MNTLTKKKIDFNPLSRLIRLIAVFCLAGAFLLVSTPVALAEDNINIAVTNSPEVPTTDHPITTIVMITDAQGAPLEDANVTLLVNKDRTDHISENYGNPAHEDPAPVGMTQIEPGKYQGVYTVSKNGLWHLSVKVSKGNLNVAQTADLHVPVPADITAITWQLFVPFGALMITVFILFYIFRTESDPALRPVA